ncbi:MAG: restriction endonuclease subunit S [Prevotella sp.]|nr:restriction endonuclease subunit S [Prevotella sp.]
MSEWKKVKLGECIATKKGFAFKSSQYVSQGIPVVRVSDFTLNSISEKDLVYYPLSEYDNYLDYVLYEKDILIQTVGSWQYNPNSVVGKVVRVPYYHKGSLLNQNIVKIIPNSDICKDFIYFRLKCLDFSGFVVGEARGAANQASITLDTIKRFSFALPPIYTQQRIATILSRYDSLIENFQKQIKLLEEAAQRLYKEWFVDLRFPGHENTKIVDGVPEGWIPAKLENLVEFKRGKTITKKDAVDGSIPVVAGGLEPAYYCDRSNTAERVITVSGSGANAGFTRMYFEKVWASDCSFVDIKTTPFLHFVYCFLKDNKKTIDNMQKGSAQPHVYAKDINAMNLNIPSIVILATFEKQAIKYYDSISTIQFQIRLLTEARDRLLPKLMSYEILVQPQ